jgi:hypothetical protein
MEVKIVSVTPDGDGNNAGLAILHESDVRGFQAVDQ